tara:strand:- start:4156 stop:5487 length:1332 start_codon:yes stop_codon:yes gene_type:complete
MSQSLTEIAQKLKDSNKKVQLIYAFNGSGKTRLSHAFKDLVTPSSAESHPVDDVEPSRNKILYYNAFTEDLFYWDNDSLSGAKPKLKIQPNSFTGWLIQLLQELGEERNIASHFQRYTSSKATPIFNEDHKEKQIGSDGKEIEVKIPAYSEVSFQVAATNPNEPEAFDPSVGDEPIVAQGQYETIKISKGEESNFVWSVMFSLLEQVISALNEQEVPDRITDKFNQLEYVFIDDPVSSLDDSHLIELAVDLATLIKNSAFTESRGLKFILTTHSPLFYNVLYNELNNDLENPNPDGTPRWLYKRGQSAKFRLNKKADGTFELLSSNDHPFSYHLFLLSEINQAIKAGQIKRYHFSFLRNILEKTATFLGYERWEHLLEKKADGTPNPFVSRLMNLASHSAHGGEEVADIDDKDKVKLDELVKYLTKTYGFKKHAEQGGSNEKP